MSGFPPPLFLTCTTRPTHVKAIFDFTIRVSLLLPPLFFPPPSTYSFLFFLRKLRRCRCYTDVKAFLDFSIRVSLLLPPLFSLPPSLFFLFFSATQQKQRRCRRYAGVCHLPNDYNQRYCCFQKVASPASDCLSSSWVQACSQTSVIMILVSSTCSFYTCSGYES